MDGSATDGSRFDLHAPAGMVADVLRLVALASVPVSLLWVGTESAVRFALVFVVLLVPRFVGVPRPFDAAYGATLLLAAWASSLHWYAEIPWMDIIVHFVTTGATAAMVYLVLARLDFLRDLQDEPLHSRRSSIVLLTVALGLAAGAVWELYEWVAENWLNADVIVGYDDTIGDLTMDGLGSLAAGLALVAWARAGFGVASRSTEDARGRDHHRGSG